VPLLHDVLERYQATAFLDIELKVPGLESSTLDLLRAHPPARGYVISSFLPEVLEAVHGMDAAVPLGLICETRAQLSLWLKSPGNAVMLYYKLVSRSAIANIKSAGKQVMVWTVNSTKDMKRFASWEVDGIISDSPEELVRTLGRPEPKINN
jgi:glycerophosphoryl diester phosphodiesterase